MEGNTMNIIYKSKLYMCIEDFNERIWERWRSKDTQLPLKTAFRYWILNCIKPW